MTYPARSAVADPSRCPIISVSYRDCKSITLRVGFHDLSFLVRTKNDKSWNPTRSVIDLQSRYDTEMIGHLEGSATALRAGYVILSAGGGGYKVAVTRAAMTSFAVGAKIALWTHLAVREEIGR